MSFRAKLIELLAGTDDARQYVLREVVKDLYRTIGPEDILKEEHGTWTYRGRALTQLEVKQLKEEAQLIQRLKLWEVLKNEVEHHANRKIFKEAATTFQLESGRMLVYVFDIIQTRLNKML